MEISGRRLHSGNSTESQWNTISDLLAESEPHTRSAWCNIFPLLKELVPHGCTKESSEPKNTSKSFGDNASRSTSMKSTRLAIGTKYHFWHRESDLDYHQKTAQTWLDDKKNGASRAKFEVCCHADDGHTPLYVRANPGALYLHLSLIPQKFTTSTHQVGSASNRYGIEMDGLLASGRRLQVGRQATYASAPPQFRSDNLVQNQGNTRAQLVPYRRKKKKNAA